MEGVTVHVATPGAVRPMTFTMPAVATIAALKETISDSMRVLVQEQRIHMGPVGASSETLDDARGLWELRAQAGDPVLVTLMVIPLSLLVLCGGGGSSSGAKLCLWDAERGEQLQELLCAADSVLCTAVDWAGQRALSGGWEGALRLWDLALGKAVHELVVEPLAQCGFPSGSAECGVLCLAADWAAQRALSGGQDGWLRLWDLQTYAPVQGWTGHSQPVFCVALDMNVRRAVSGGQDRILRYWSLDPGASQCLQELKGHSGTVFCVDVEWYSQRAISGSWDCTLRLWDLARAETIQELRGHSNAVFCVAMDWTTQRLVSGSSDHTICVWDLKQQVPLLGRLQGHKETVTCLEVDWTQQRVVSGSVDGTLHLWDLDSGVALQLLQGSVDEVRCVKARWPVAASAARTRSKTVPR